MSKCNHIIFIIFFATSFGVFVIDSVAGEEQRQPELLASRPQVSLQANKHVATPDELKSVAALVDRLTEIDKPDFGFSHWMSGSQFAPIAESQEFNTGIIMIDHQLQTNDVLKQLVALGPKSLPVLLERLTDSTPTKLTMQHKGMFGAQWYGNDVQLNAARSVERDARKTFAEFFAKVDRSDQQNRIAEHVITIGDVCFAIIGQIVNRGYQASRYQPTACRVINSPTQDPRIAEVVRAIWRGQDSAQMLLDSLLDDFYTDQQWYGQSGAAMRLLYYFPDESSEIIAKRIRELNLIAPTDADTSTKVWIGNGLDVQRFLKAIRNNDHPVVTQALSEVVQRTDRADFVAAALNARVVELGRDAVFRKIQGLLSDSTPPDHGWYTAEYKLLLAATHHFPLRSKCLFEKYCQHDTTDSLRTCIHALDEPQQKQDWMVDFLVNFLDDQTDTGWEYGPDYDRQPIRLCDESAKILAKHYFPSAEFEYEKNPAYLDQQIAKIKRVLAGDKNVLFARALPKTRPANFPIRKPIQILHLNENLGQFYSISDHDSIWVDGWNESVEIDTKSGDVIRRVPTERRVGQESHLPGGKPGHTYAYYGNNGGHVLDRDIRNGNVVAEVNTPFNDGVRFDDPLQVRHLNDVTMCGTDSQWLIACTSDGALHSIEMASGDHTIEYRFKKPVHGFAHVTLLGTQNGSTVLIEGMGKNPPFDTSLHLWDQSTRKLQTIEKVPTSGWTTFSGSLGVNTMNGYVTVWDLQKAEEIELFWRNEPIVSVACSDDQTTLYLLRKSGAIDVAKVNDSIAVPVRRLSPGVDTPQRGTLTVCQDGQHVLWHADVDRP